MIFVGTDTVSVLLGRAQVRVLSQVLSQQVLGWLSAPRSCQAPACGGSAMGSIGSSLLADAVPVCCLPGTELQLGPSMPQGAGHLRSCTPHPDGEFCSDSPSPLPPTPPRCCCYLSAWHHLQQCRPTLLSQHSLAPFSYGICA